MPQIGDSVAGYRIERLLGRGGMAVRGQFAESHAPARVGNGAGRSSVKQRSRAEPVVSVSHRSDDCEVDRPSRKEKLAKWTSRSSPTAPRSCWAPAIVFLIISFFNWFEVDSERLSARACGTASAFLAGLLAIAMVVWQGIRLANIEIEIGVTPAMITAALAMLLFIFTLIRFIAKPGGVAEQRSSTARSGRGSASSSRS